MNTKIPQEELEVFCSLEGIKTVIDVGSREDLDMFDLRPNYKYHMFEPHKPFYDSLKEKSMGHRNIHLYNVALSDDAKEMEYDQVTQSFVNPISPLKCSYKTAILDDFNIKADFIKIDAEGMDYSILKGAKNTIKQAKYIQVEYWDGARKFTELLKDFEFYLMMEPRLREVAVSLGGDKYLATLIPLDVNFVDNVLIRQGAGGNLLAIRK